MRSIDLNCDVGESFGHFKIGNDTNIFPYISSCNIACGFHGGDPYHIQKTIDLALKYDVKIGAHPSYPDRHGFGRREIQLSDEELIATIKYQIAALKGMVEVSGGELSHVKPHGALYNAVATKEPLARLVIGVMKSFDKKIALMGLAGSMVERLAEDEKIGFISEAFADRRYTSMGQLVSRMQSGAVINDPKEAANQVLNIALNNSVIAIDGNAVEMQADSFCVHGDNPDAELILKKIKELLKKEGISLKATPIK